MSWPAETHNSNLRSPRVRYPLAILSLKISLALIVFFLTTLGTVICQQPAADEDVVRVTTDLLLFPIRIRDKQGRTTTGLTERDLLLKDANHAVSAVHFSAGAERIALVFALDQSGSLHQIISQQQDAAVALFEHFNQRSRIAILRFAESPSVIQEFGRDTSAARAAFTFSAAANQHTAIFDGAAAAIRMFDSLAPDRSERRIVILISDGLDNASKSKPGSVINDALEKHISFYVIHLPLFEPRGGHLAVRQPAKGFRELAEKTGGKYFIVGGLTATLSPSTNANLDPVFQAIEEDLKSQYLLGFYIAETARDGRRHGFSVSLREGLEYSVGKFGYSRKHDFFVNMRPQQ